MIKILIVDDHPIVRRGTKQIVEEAPDMMVADEASNGAEVLTKVSENNFDIVLLDISMPGRSGLDVLKDLKSKKPNLPVLILSAYSEKQFALQALKDGASGYLTKTSASFELITAIRKASQGKKYISSSLAEILASNVSEHAEKQPHEMLSKREYQVMCMIGSGKSLVKIAQDLSLSAKTISTYRTRILKKMNMKHNAQLIQYALQNHLLY